MNQVDHAATERAVFWQHPHFHGMGLLKARFRQHRYALHTHPTYVIALITGGCERVRVGRRHAVAPAGSVLVVNPEECHDGEAGCDEGWAYRTFYPPVALMAEIARDLGKNTVPIFPRTVLADPVLAAGLARAHGSAEDGDDGDAETAMLLALRRLVLEHADGRRPPQATGEAGAARRMEAYRALIEGDVAERFELARFAALSGVTRFQVIRDFREMTGFTPGSFVRDRRLRSAACLIAAGAALADAAGAAGFADQSHLSRAFKLAYGVTPGHMRRAFMGA